MLNPHGLAGEPMNKSFYMQNKEFFATYQTFAWYKFERQVLDTLPNRVVVTELNI